MIEERDGRVSIYDWVRIIATLLVVIGHSTYISLNTAIGGVDYQLPSNISPVYNNYFFEMIRAMTRWVYGFHMPLFFVLSGAVLGLKAIPKFDRFVVSKVKRLLIPYWVYGCLFMIPVKYLAGFYTKDTVLSAMRFFLSGQEAGHMWFLTALFWCMIVFVMLSKILSKWTDSVYLILLLCGVIQMLHENIPFDILGMKFGLGYIFWFALGYVLESERKNIKKWNLKKR